MCWEFRKLLGQVVQIPKLHMEKYEKMCGTDRKDWFGEKFAAKPHIVIEIYGMGPWFMMVYTQKKLPMSGWSKNWDPEETKTN